MNEAVDVGESPCGAVQNSFEHTAKLLGIRYQISHFLTLITRVSTCRIHQNHSVGEKELHFMFDNRIRGSARARGSIIYTGKYSPGRWHLG